MLKKIWHVFLACFLIFVSVSGVLAFPLSVSAATSSTINICIVDYSGHVDTSPNADMTAILAADPNILIDNTAYSLWGINGNFSGTADCIPSKYTPSGIQVFSYITSGYEGSEYSGGVEDSISANETRIAGMATEGCTGVFIDEVSTSLTGSQLTYMQTLYNYAHNLGLKVIINTGVNSFSYATLATVSDYIMTNETYTSGSMTASETGYNTAKGYSGVMVVDNNSSLNASTATTASENAWAAGYRWSFATVTNYASLPTYLSTYVSNLQSYKAAATLGSLSTSSLTANTVTLNGSVTSVGGNNPTVSITYGTVNGGLTLSAPSSAWANVYAPTSPSQPQTAASFSLNVTGLSPSTTYYYNATAVNTGGQSWVSSSGTFTTSSGGGSTVIIAASNSNSTWKSEATKTCSGTADEVTINTYLTAGATVELAPGTYNITDTTGSDEGVLIQYSNIHLYGQGNTTILNLSSSGVYCWDCSNIQIDHMEVEGTVGAANGGAISWQGDANESGFTCTNIECTATGGANEVADYWVLSDASGVNLSNIVFSEDDANAPDGMGFELDGNAVSTSPEISNATFFDDTVENAGIAGTRNSAYVTGFDFAESPASLIVNGCYVLDCSVNGAWESAFHMEDAPTKTNFVITGCSAQNAGEKPGYTYGYGYLIGLTSAQTGDVVEYNNTASSCAGGAMILDGTVYATMVNGISPTSSSKSTSAISSSNCVGVNIKLTFNTNALVMYSNNGSSVNQSVSLGGYYSVISTAPSGSTFTISGTSGTAVFPYYEVAQIISTYSYITVSSPSTLTTTTATLNGNVLSVGAGNPTITFYYDTTNYGNTTVGWAHNVSATYAGGIASFSANVSSLVAGTMYYFDAKADNTGSGGGVSWSGVSSFIDLPNAPTSPAATPITSQVNFSWTPATGGTGTTIYTQIQYSVSGYPSAYNTGVTGLSWTTSSSGAVSGLVGGQLYYFSLFSEAVNGTNISYSVANATISATPLAGTTTGTTTGLPNNPNGFVDAPVIGQVGGDNYVIMGSILNSSFLINSIVSSGGTTTTGTNQILGSSEGKLLWETLLPLAIIIFGAIMIFMNWKHPVKMMVIFIILVLMLIIVQAFIHAIG